MSCIDLVLIWNLSISMHIKCFSFSFLVGYDDYIVTDVMKSIINCVSLNEIDYNYTRCLSTIS